MEIERRRDGDRKEERGRLTGGEWEIERRRDGDREEQKRR